MAYQKYCVAEDCQDIATLVRFFLCVRVCVFYGCNSDIKKITQLLVVTFDDLLFLFIFLYSFVM